MHGRHSGSQGARTALRAVTRDVHERLHLAPAFLAISEGRLERKGYGELLGQLAALYFGLASQLGIDPARLKRLAGDLASLNVPMPEPLASKPPGTDASKLGWRYVVEGSIFGGQVIYRQLDYLFGAAEGGRRFFAGSPEASSRWRALCVDIERTGDKEEDLQDMIAGACDAFAHFERQLVGERVHG